MSKLLIIGAVSTVFTTALLWSVTYGKNKVIFDIDAMKESAGSRMFEHIVLRATSLHAQLSPTSDAIVDIVFDPIDGVHPVLHINFNARMQLHDQVLVKDANEHGCTLIKVAVMLTPEERANKLLQHIELWNKRRCIRDAFSSMEMENARLTPVMYVEFTDGTPSLRTVFDDSEWYIVNDEVGRIKEWARTASKEVEPILFHLYEKGLHHTMLTPEIEDVFSWGGYGALFTVTDHDGKIL